MNNIIQVTPEVVTDDILNDLASMMYSLKHETDEHATDDRQLYRKYIIHKVATSSIYYIEQSGFVMIDSIFDPLLKLCNSNYWLMTHIYIVPNMRKTRVYAALINKSLQEHSGLIIGITYTGSEHNRILKKRYKVLGTIYGTA